MRRAARGAIQTIRSSLAGRRVEADSVITIAVSVTRRSSPGNCDNSRIWEIRAFPKFGGYIPAMPTYADIETRMTAAVTALDASDYATAIVNATAAQALLAIIPDSEKRSHAGGSMTFDREGIERFIAQVRKLQRDATADNGTGGIESVPIVFGSANCFTRGDHCDE